MTLKLLFLHPAGSFGGASKSLIELYKVLSSKSVEGMVICPAGNAAPAFSEAGLEVLQVRGLSQLDNTRYGYYRGYRWLILLRELFLLPGTWLALRRVLLTKQFDIIHLNEATLLPWARIIRRYSGAPIVVHVRSLQRGDAGDWRTRWFNRALTRDANKIIAIDETVRRTLPLNASVAVIHNGFSVTSSDNRLTEDVLRVGIVGVLLKLKGVYEFVEAARILLKERKLKIQFFIVGENARSLTGWKSRILKALDFAHDVRGDLETYIHAHGLQDQVHLTGFVKNVDEVYSKLDLLCFPSHLDAAGRPVFEAAFYGVPSVVAVRNPPPDTIVDGGTGICIDQPDSVLLADAVERLYSDRVELCRLGYNARNLAESNFDTRKNAEKLLDVYAELLSTN